MTVNTFSEQPAPTDPPRPVDALPFALLGEVTAALP